MSVCLSLCVCVVLCLGESFSGSAEDLKFLSLGCVLIPCFLAFSCGLRVPTASHGFRALGLGCKVPGLGSLGASGVESRGPKNMNHHGAKSL